MKLIKEHTQVNGDPLNTKSIRSTLATAINTGVSVRKNCQVETAAHMNKGKILQRSTKHSPESNM